MSERKYTYENQPYIRQLLELEPSGKGVEHLMVIHDSWCPMLSGTGLCCCRPVVRKPE